jgi:hypothetical protein
MPDEELRIDILVVRGSGFWVQRLRDHRFKGSGGALFGGLGFGVLG